MKTPHEQGDRDRRLAFKTGTSYGYRDFWSVGYDPGVTIGVWAGRPDGTPIPGGSGRLSAAPIMFKIADLLGPSPPRNDAPLPPGAILVGRQNLPPRLQRLDPRPRARTTSQTSGLTIVYPPDGALIEWRGEEVPLEVSGGKAPFRWLVDSKPLRPAPSRRPIYWQPDGIGFAQLAVIDADGRSARTTVRLSPWPRTPRHPGAGLHCQEPRNVWYGRKARSARAELEVRIHLPPAVSPLSGVPRTPSATGAASGASLRLDWDVRSDALPLCYLQRHHPHPEHGFVTDVDIVLAHESQLAIISHAEHR